MLHQHLADALALEGHAASEQFVEDHPHGVNIDLLAVAAVGHLGRHVVHGADAFRVSAAAAARDELRQPVVAHLHHALVAENVARLQVAVYDAALVQIGHAGADTVDPGQSLPPAGVPRACGQKILQGLVGDVLHHHPRIAAVVLADIVESQQVRVLQVEALADAAQFDFEVPSDQLRRHVLAGIAGGVVDFAKAALAHAAFDGVAGQGTIAASVLKTVRHSRRRRRWRRRMRQCVAFVRFQGCHPIVHGRPPLL